MISVDRGVGDELLLRFRPDDAVPDAEDWSVATQASEWVLALSDAVLSSVESHAGAVEFASKALSGSAVNNLEVTPTLALVVVFSDGRWLEVQGQTSDLVEEEQENDPPYWEVLRPDDVLVSAGPGLRWSRATAMKTGSQHEPRPKPELQLAGQGTADLLQLWAQATAELKRRGIVRNAHAALHDVATERVREAFEGFRGTYRDAGWDVLSRDGRRIEVKAIQVDPKRPPTVALHRAFSFDLLVVVAFDDEFNVRGAWQVPGQELTGIFGAASNRSKRVQLRRLLANPLVEPLAL